MGMCRKKVIKNNCMRIVETGIYGAATITLMAIIVITLNECKEIPPCIDCIDVKSTKSYDTELEQFIEWNCPEN